MLLPLCDKPVINHVFHQLSFSKRLSNIILATSNDVSDDLLKEWAKNNNRDCYRGSLDNVLERYYFAAKKYQGDVIVRVTADCPLIDPTVVDLVIDHFLSGQYDYFSNTMVPTFPDGLDTEVFTFAALEKAYKTAKWKSEIEHVTSYIKKKS